MFAGAGFAWINASSWPGTWLGTLPCLERAVLLAHNTQYIYIYILYTHYIYILCIIYIYYARRYIYIYIYICMYIYIHMYMLFVRNLCLGGTARCSFCRCCCSPRLWQTHHIAGLRRGRYVAAICILESSWCNRPDTSPDLPIRTTPSIPPLMLPRARTSR